MVEQNFLTATEALHLAETSMSMKNHLYKQIKEEAKECHTSTIWSIEGCSNMIVDKLVADLERDGYVVCRDEDDSNILNINWDHHE